MMWISVIVTLAILLTISPLWDDDDSERGRRAPPHWVSDPESYYPNMPTPELLAVGSHPVEALRGESWARKRARFQARRKLAQVTTRAQPSSDGSTFFQAKVVNLRQVAEWRSPEGRLYVLMGMPRS